MKFRNYLIEVASDGKYKDKIELDDAIKIFKEHCKNCDVNTPLWRGMRDGHPYYIFEGSKSSRISTSDVGIHNIVIDEVIKRSGKDYPLRNKSIIAIGNKGKANTSNFGRERYAIFPYDDVVIASVLFSSDILDSMLIVDKYDNNGEFLEDITIDVYDMGLVLNNLCDGEDVESFDKLCEMIFANNDRIHFKRYFGKSSNKKEVADCLLKMFKLSTFSFYNTKNIPLNDSEVWIGGKCLAIHESQLKKFVELLESDSK